jgi:FkbM family methyltransferase
MYLAADGRLPPIDMSLDAFEVETTQLFETLLEPGMVVIDVGAHVGYYTLIAAKAVGPTGKVFAFEPDDSNYSLLIKNVEINGYSNVVAVKQAVSNYVGYSTLELSPWHSGIHHIDYSGQQESSGVQVETTTVDTFLGSQESLEISLVKIDVEGSEERVLDGMSQLFENSGKLNVILEYHPPLLERSGVDPREFLHRLTTSNFNVRCINDGQPSMDDTFDLDSFVDAVWENGVNLLCTRK